MTVSEILSVLKRLGLTLSTAESCTGGMVGEMITAVPGASSVYPGGVICYCDRVKADVVGVSRDTLAEYTAVSGQTCEEMAKGIKALMHTDVGLAVTGYAGPADPTDPDDKTGLVYYGIAWGERCYVIECHFEGDRDSIRHQTADALFASLSELLAPMSESN